MRRRKFALCKQRSSIVSRVNEMFKAGQLFAAFVPLFLTEAAAATLML
jgi:hypothetical protein